MTRSYGETSPCTTSCPCVCHEYGPLCSACRSKESRREDYERERRVRESGGFGGPYDPPSGSLES